MKPKEKIIFLIVFFLFSIFVISKFFLFPLIFQFKKNLLLSLSKEKELLSLELQVAQVKKFLEEKKEKKFSELEKIFFDPEFPLPLAEFLKEKSKIFGVTIENTSLEFSSGKSKKNPTLFLKVSGEIENIFKFFYFLENSFFVSQTLELSLLKKEGNTYFLQIKILPLTS